MTATQSYLVLCGTPFNVDDLALYIPGAKLSYMAMGNYLQLVIDKIVIGATLNFSFSVDKTKAVLICRKST